MTSHQLLTKELAPVALWVQAELALLLNNRHLVA